MANKIAGLTYVDEFTFSTEQGFTGSAGKHNVRGYYRGGAVKKDHVKAAAQKPRAPGPGASHGGYASASKEGMPANVKARGGTVGVTTPRRGKSMPQQGKQKKYAAKSAAKAHGGKMYAEGGSVHDKLRAEGEKMGYAYGGTVKNTSAEFVEKRGKQDTMDNANFPPVNEASQRDKESGPRKSRRPRFKGGGGVRQVRAAEGGQIFKKDMERIPLDLSKIKGHISDSDREHARRIAKSKKYKGRISDKESKAARKIAGKGMPKGVKAKGGLAHYAAGGYAEGGTKKGEEAGSLIRLTKARLAERAGRMRELTAESLAASRAMTGASPRAGVTRTKGPTLANDPALQVGTTSTATEEAKAKSRTKPEPSIKQTGVGKHGEATFGRPMKPVMHVKLAGGGVVSAAKGGKKRKR